jgi:hypothetical protein
MLLSWFGLIGDAPGGAMARKTFPSTFVQQIKRQLLHLRAPDFAYRALHVYVSGVSGPWEFAAQDEFEFHEDTGVLIIRDGPSDEAGNDNQDVPEYVFRLDAIVATQLV